MPRKQPLKVYRTPIGFHDAYVATPSRKAALAAWGSDVDLFARGMAEVVTDEALTAEALASPGTVIRRLRGTDEEHLAALPPDLPRRKAETSAPAVKPSAAARRPAAKPSRPPPKPRPSRASLDAAEQRLETLRQTQQDEDAMLHEREEALARERRDMERTHRRDLTAAERALEAERQAHAEALDRWLEEQR